MSSGKISRIAVAQVGTVVFDTRATLEKLEKFVIQAKEQRADLVLFPEAFIGGYPKWSDFGIVLGTRTNEGREEYVKYYESAIEENGPESKKIEGLAKTHNIHIVTGVIERSFTSIYCSVFFYGPSGYLGKHQKLLPTALERCIWSNGDANTMKVFDTPIGKIGSAICWENYMPLYRFYLYSQGVELYLAPTVDDRDVWLSTMRTIALEGRCYVVSACQFLQGKDFPEDYKVRKIHGDEKILIRGGSCAVDPLGTVLLEPNFTGEMLRTIDIDISTNIKGRLDLNPIGHYNRPDVFQLHVTKPNPNLHNGVIEHAEH